MAPVKKLIAVCAPLIMLQLFKGEVKLVRKLDQNLVTISIALVKKLIAAHYA